MKMIKRVALIWLILSMLYLLMIGFLFSGMGGGSQFVPADEDQAAEYQIIGNGVGVDWTWIMLVDIFMVERAKKSDLTNQNPVYTGLNFVQLQIDIHTEDEEDGLSYEYTIDFYGADEILDYLGLPAATRDFELIKSRINSKKSRTDWISIIPRENFLEVLQEYYDFDQEMIETILELEESNYLIEFYGNGFSVGTGDNPNYELGEIPIPDAGMEIPLYLQYQHPWGGVPFGGNTIATSGCSVTCIAMVFSYLKGNAVYPPDIVDWTGNRYYVPPAGQSWSIFSATSNQWGIRCTNLGMNMNLVIDALNSGKPVIVSVKPGTFTKAGHFIVLRGIENGRILVNDPNDSSKKGFFNQSFEVELIRREAKNFWCFQ